MSTSENGPLTSTIQTQEKLRDAEARAAAQRGRLAGVRDRLDEVIDAAEALHLTHGGAPSTPANDELIAQATAALDQAAAVTGYVPSRRPQPDMRVNDVMDIVWDAQEQVLRCAHPEIDNLDAVFEQSPRAASAAEVTRHMAQRERELDLDDERER
jgi:hypothetical protein